VVSQLDSGASRLRMLQCGRPLVTHHSGSCAAVEKYSLSSCKELSCVGACHAASVMLLRGRCAGVGTSSSAPLVSWQLTCHAWAGHVLLLHLQHVTLAHGLALRDDALCVCCSS
jgi:hypothetical protein